MLEYYIMIGLIAALILSGIICILGVIYCNRSLERNKQVYVFRSHLIDMLDSYINRHIKTITEEEYDTMVRRFLHKWSYQDMLESTKPLILEEWFTEEEINKINS